MQFLRDKWPPRRMRTLLAIKVAKGINAAQHTMFSALPGSACKRGKLKIMNGQRKNTIQNDMDI